MSTMDIDKTFLYWIRAQKCCISIKSKMEHGKTTVCVDLIENTAQHSTHVQGILQKYRFCILWIFHELALGLSENDI